MKSYLFRTKEEALEVAKELGCEGYHKTKRKSFKPCKSQGELNELENNAKKAEIDELVDYDGTMNNSKIPILDPATTAPGLSTMDKRVASGHQTQDPLTRGYRVYYGESVVREEDMSDAFGYEETEDEDFMNTVDIFIKDFGFDEDKAKDRAREQGKVPDTEISDNNELKKKKGFIDTMRLVEKEKSLTKDDVQKMAENILLQKSDDRTISSKDEEISPIILRNIKALKNMANAEGISIPKIIKMFKDE